jgi:hypothetical protein
MRTRTINIYKYDELSDRAKEAARDWWRQGALDYDWYDCYYEDAARVGIKITGFDTGRSCEITGEFINSAEDTAEKILAEYGNGSDSLAAEARHYQKTLAEFMATAEKDEDGELATWALVADKEDIDKDFLRAVLENYLVALREEAEHLQSDEVAEETIVANDYEFTENGKPA